MNREEKEETREEIDKVAKLTAQDVLQLSGTIGAYFVACVIMAKGGFGDVPIPALLAIGGIGAMIKPRTWLHGPLAAIAAIFLWRGGMGFLPMAPWAFLFLCGICGRNCYRVTGDRRMWAGGMLALLAACIGVLAGLPPQ